MSHDELYAKFCEQHPLTKFVVTEHQPYGDNGLVITLRSSISLKIEYNETTGKFDRAKPRCASCGKITTDLMKCRSCGEDKCEDCLVDLTLHNMIDFPFCKLCQEVSDEYRHTMFGNT